MPSDVSPEGTTTDPQPGIITRLMDDLIPLGEKLPESHKPSPATLPHLLAGLLYWLETGSTEPPKVEITQVSPVTSQDAEIAKLKAELESAKAAASNAANPIPASPVAPAPISPAVPVASSPTPTVTPPEASTPPAAVPVPPVGDVPSAPAS